MAVVILRRCSDFRMFFVFLMIPFWRLVVQHYQITDRDIDRIQQSLIDLHLAQGNSYNGISVMHSVACQ